MLHKKREILYACYVHIISKLLCTSLQTAYLVCIWCQGSGDRLLHIHTLCIPTYRTYEHPDAVGEQCRFISNIQALRSKVPIGCETDIHCWRYGWIWLSLKTRKAQGCGLHSASIWVHCAFTISIQPIASMSGKGSTRKTIPPLLSVAVDTTNTNRGRIKFSFFRTILCLWQRWKYGRIGSFTQYTKGSYVRRKASHIADNYSTTQFSRHSGSLFRGWVRRGHCHFTEYLPVVKCLRCHISPMWSTR